MKVLDKRRFPTWPGLDNRDKERQAELSEACVKASIQANLALGKFLDELGINMSKAITGDVEMNDSEFKKLLVRLRLSRGENT